MRQIYKNHNYLFMNIIRRLGLSRQTMDRWIFNNFVDFETRNPMPCLEVGVEFENLSKYFR